MTISVAQFRLDLPEFADETTYLDSTAGFWLGLATQLINADRFGPSGADPWPDVAPFPTRTVYDMACEMFVAHNLVLEKKAFDASVNGLAPGLSEGPISSKSVDKASVSYDTQAGLRRDAGHWNLTTYGTRLMYLFDMFGAGPIQLGIGVVPPYSTGLGFGAYVGPDYGSFSS